jgi:NADPH-dependent 2,4-dienoyl-CoA reductase/sulfur reductase-like enzyme
LDQDSYDKLGYSGFQTVRPKTRAVVVGGGFIGLETAENLLHRGFDVTCRDGRSDPGTLDLEMARIAESYVEQHGSPLALNDGVAGSVLPETRTGTVNCERERSP